MNKKSAHTSLGIIPSKASPKKTEVFDTYWKFATLRQDIFLKRFNHERLPWTNDPILLQYKFTNVYRASDRVSQYLIRNVIYNKELPDSNREVLFRILLFKLFNKIETWELLCNNLGALTFQNYDFDKYNAVLSKAYNKKQTIYSAAYIMASLKSFFGHERKHANHLKLIEWIMNREIDKRLCELKSMQDAFELLKTIPGFGDFLAYQLTIDINYSEITNFNESEFVVAGPGAKGGISKCFSDKDGLSDEGIIKYMTERQHKEFERLGLNFHDLWGRPLQLIDCQNIFCEVDKYARIKHPDIKGDSDRTRIKQHFRANTRLIEYFFPPKWGINNNIIKP